MDSQERTDPHPQMIDKRTKGGLITMPFIIGTEFHTLHALFLTGIVKF